MAIDGQVRKIVAEDINWGQDQVNIQKADGTTVTASQININIIPYGNKRPVLNLTQFKDALSEFSVNGGVIEVCSPIILDADTTIPENIWLDIKKDCPITVPAGVTLTVNGGITAGLYKIFDGDGTVTGNPKMEAVYPEWFGAKGDGITNDSIAIQKAIDFAYQATNVNTICLKQRYLVGTTIFYKSGLVFDGVRASRVYVANGVTAFAPDSSLSLVQYVYFRNMRIEGLNDQPVADTIGINIKGTFNVVAEDVTLERLDKAIYSDDVGVTTSQGGGKRFVLDGFEAYHCNYVLYLAPKTGTYTGLAYGDFTIKNGTNVEGGENSQVAFCLNSLDGLNMSGITGFPYGVGFVHGSGNFWNITNCNFFETWSGEHIKIDGGYYINISGVTTARSGFKGTSPQDSIKISNTSLVHISGIMERPTGNGLVLENCSGVSLCLSVYNANYWDSGLAFADTTNTYSGCEIIGCKYVSGSIVANSTYQKYGLNVDSTSSYVSVQFAGLNCQTKIVNAPFDANVVIDTSNQVPVITVSDGSTAPDVKRMSGIVLRFKNTIATSVTELVNPHYFGIYTILILDTNTTIVSSTNGGKFITKSGANITGYNARATFVYNAETGYFLEI